MSSSAGASDRSDKAAATPSRPPLEADDTPIGRDWVEWAKHLEAENKWLRGSLEATERDYERLRVKLAEYDKYVGGSTRHA